VTTILTQGAHQQNTNNYMRGKDEEANFIMHNVLFVFYQLAHLNPNQKIGI
jgi:hypothetical protein